MKKRVYKGVYLGVSKDGRGRSAVYLDLGTIDGTCEKLFFKVVGSKKVGYIYDIEQEDGSIFVIKSTGEDYSSFIKEKSHQDIITTCILEVKTEYDRVMMIEKKRKTLKQLDGFDKLTRNQIRKNPKYLSYVRTYLYFN